MRAPIAFTYGNCIFASGLRDPWAAFAVTPASYQWLTVSEKYRRMTSIMGAIEAVGADLQIVRVEKRQEAGRYESEVRAEAAGLTEASPLLDRARDAYLRSHASRLQLMPTNETQVFFFVSLREPEVGPLGIGASSESGVTPRWWKRVLGDVAAVGGRRMLSADELERTRVCADQAAERIRAFLPARAVRGVELQWLVRRSFCRGLGEPAVDGLHEPRALAFERNGKAQLAPLEGDVMRWADGHVIQSGRALRVESELGSSFQAHLVMGAIPDRLDFPGSGAEMMFAPIEGVPFPIDLSLNARFVPNEVAVRLARRRIQDADQIMRAELDGDQGVSDAGFERTQQARDLLAHLQKASKPPLLRATLAVAVSAASEDELEMRVEACRRAFGETTLHRPHGDQLRLFVQHLPAQRTQVVGYDDTLTTEQVGAMVPTATHIAGSKRGFYLGRTVSASQRAVRFNLREGSERDGNVTILSVGALGSGKTTLAQKLQYEAFLQGARVVDCDPKGDHRFHLLDDVAPRAEIVSLRPHPSLRGMLDPLRVAPPQLAQDTTISFLRSLLPVRAEPAWETSIVAAVDRVMTNAKVPTCLEVVHALLEGPGVDPDVGQALEVYARTGLTQLGFADPRTPPRPVGQHQVTYIPIRDLPAPPPDTRRSDYSQSERTGEQIVRLIAMFAMHLMGAERDRLKVFAFDEGWRLLGDPVGRAMLGSLQRMGRSELAVPIISTQLVTDALVGERESLENLIGATFVFGMRSEVEAARSLALLGLDPEDRRMRRSLIEMRAGQCLFRDHAGRIEQVQVEVAMPSLLSAFSTTPPTK